MKKSRMLIITTTLICGLGVASVGISQTKTTTKKSSKTTVNNTKAVKTKAAHPVSGKTSGDKVSTSASNAGKKIVDTRADRFDARNVVPNECLKAMREGLKYDPIIYDKNSCTLTLGNRRLDLRSFRMAIKTRQRDKGTFVTLYFLCEDGEQCIENLQTKERSRKMGFYGYYLPGGHPSGLTDNDIGKCINAFRAGCR